MGESQEHGRCIGVPLSHLGCHLVLFDPLVWDRHPSFISYNFSSGRPPCPLLLDCICLNYWKLWVCKTLLPMSAQLSDRPWIGNTRPASRYCASNQSAPHMLLMVWEPSPIITGGNSYFRLHRGMCPWVGFCSLLQKVFFIQKKWVTTGFLARWLN